MIWTAFILGLFGSLHCAGMCGPLALATPATGSGTIAFVAGRLIYNLGRLGTYGLLGLVCGLAGQVLLIAGVQRWLSLGLGLALLAGVLTSRRLGVSQPIVGAVSLLKGRMSRLLQRRAFSSLALLGLLNGCLPCGLVYVACAAAAVAGSAVAGVAVMVAFGLGTIPLMLAMGLSGRLVPVSWRLRLVKAVPFAVCGLAALLILRGLALGIPYLSPDLSAAHGSCCHH